MGVPDVPESPPSLALIMGGSCPRCLGALGEGWRCPRCGFDAVATCGEEETGEV